MLPSGLSPDTTWERKEGAVMELDPHLYLYDLRAGWRVDDEHAQQNIGNPNFGSYLYQDSTWISDPTRNTRDFQKTGVKTFNPFE